MKHPQAPRSCCDHGFYLSDVRRKETLAQSAAHGRRSPPRDSSISYLGLCRYRAQHGTSVVYLTLGERISTFRPGYFEKSRTVHAPEIRRDTSDLENVPDFVEF